MKRFSLFILLSAVLLALSGVGAAAQFKSDAFSQDYSNSNEPADTAQTPLFSFKNYIRGLAHKDTLKIGTMFAGSMVCIGGEQIYNKQYWKLPVIYGGIGASVGLGLKYRSTYNKSLDAYNAALALDPAAPYTVNDKASTISKVMFATGALFYWGGLMDGVVNFEEKSEHLPGRATLYSALFPGLGQIYNEEYWKIPIYWGGLLAAYHFWDLYKVNYVRFKNIYTEASSQDSKYEGPIPAENAKYYRDVYRRYRDYSVLAIAAVYLLQVIDANVFAYMRDFEVNDDISMHIRPAVICPDLQYASTGTGAFGMSFGINF